MKLLIMVALIGVDVPTPQRVRQPAKRVARQKITPGAHPAEETQKKEQAADSQTTQTILSAITQIEQEQAREQQAEASEKAENAKIEGKLVSYTGLLVAAGFVQALALAFTIIAMTRQTNVLKDTAERQLRAYIGVSESGLKLEPSNIPEGQVCFKNFGQTPAYKVRQWIGINIAGHPFPGKLQEPPEGLQSSVSLISAGGYHTSVVPVKKPLPEHLVPKLGTPEGTVYVYGRIVYEDVFGKERHTDYRLIYGGREGVLNYKDAKGILVGRMKPDYEGNEAD